jgi:Family of unknown function (DUF6510)
MEDGPMETADLMLDGNAVAGQLAAMFGADVTVIPATCAHCHTVSVMGTLRAYIQAPGTVLRCPVCGKVMMRVVETPHSTLVEMRGIAYLQMDRS